VSFLESQAEAQFDVIAPLADDLLSQIAPAKMRILDTADRLFYSDGIRVVGIDRLISESNVTKATFYKHYGSKERLILDYIEGRHALAVHDMQQVLAQTADAAEPSAAEQSLRNLVGAVSAIIDKPGFRGCPFINAATEYTDPKHPVRLVVSEHRAWYADIVAELFAKMGHPRAINAAEDYMLARDGAMTGGNAGDRVASATSLRRIIYRVIDEAKS
jgi:AcrR family transcriptional regulator